MKRRCRCFGGPCVVVVGYTRDYVNCSCHRSLERTYRPECDTFAHVHMYYLLMIALSWWIVILWNPGVTSQGTPLKHRMGGKNQDFPHIHWKMIDFDPSNVHFHVPDSSIGHCDCPGQVLSDTKEIHPQNWFHLAVQRRYRIEG